MQDSRYDTDQNKPWPWSRPEPINEDNTGPNGDGAPESFVNDPASMPATDEDYIPPSVVNPVPVPFGAEHNVLNDANWQAGARAEAKARDDYPKALLDIRSYLEAVSQGHPDLKSKELVLAAARVYAPKFLRKRFRLGGKSYKGYKQGKK